MIWIIYFLSAFGLSWIIGHAKITLSLRVLLAGRKEFAAQSEIRTPQGQVIQQAFPAQTALPPLIPVVGPFLVELMECTACSGTWIGFAASFWMPMVLGSNPVAWCLIMGCATCASNLIVAKYFGR